MVVIEGTRLDALFHNSPKRSGQSPASKSAIEAMPTVEIWEGDEGECVICLDKLVIDESVKEMPCKHRFHGDCIEKWLKMHASCPVYRHTMPVEEEEGQKEGRENQGRERRREIWVSFSFRSPRRMEKAAGGSGVVGNRSNSSDSGDQGEERELEMGN